MHDLTIYARPQVRLCGAIFKTIQARKLNFGMEFM